MDELSALRSAILAGDAVSAGDAARLALDHGMSAPALVADGISPALEEVGRLFENGDYFLPDLLVAARATKSVFDVVRPLLARGGARAAGRVAIGTVRGDIHDIGKNLVTAMLEGAGLEVVDLGIDVPADRFASVAAGGDVDVIGLSALLTTSLPAMRESIDAITATGVRPGIKVIVGGAPVTPRFAETVGADGYAPSAASAVDLVLGLIRGPGRAMPAGDLQS